MLHRRLKRVSCFRTMAQLIAGISGFGLLFLFISCESLPLGRFLVASVISLVVFFGSVLFMEALAVEEKKLARAIRKAHERRLAVLYKNNYTGRRVA